MSTLEDLDDLERHEKDEKKDEDKKKDGDGKKADGDADMKDAEPEEEEEQLDEEILNSSTRDIVARRRLLENDMRIMKSEFQRLTHEKATMNEKIKDNLEKIENNRYVSQISVSMLLPHTWWQSVYHIPVRANAAQTTPIPRRQRC
jgi:26S proteasome regulatory subunit T5